MKKKGKSTIVEVASLANVSTMTVSRALREPEKVNPETRLRVEKAAKTLNYLPDRLAGGLSSRKSNTIAVLAPALDHSTFSATIRGISDSLSSQNYQMLAAYTAYSPVTELKVTQEILQHRPDGVIFIGACQNDETADLLKQHQVPAVETWAIPPKPVGYSVGFSNYECTRQMIHYMYSKGHRRIAFGGNLDGTDDRAISRKQGYLDAVQELGLSNDLVMLGGTAPLTYSHGEQIYNQIEKHENIDAIFCISDLLAAGIIFECQKRNIQVPKELAVAGFGDFAISPSIYPSITTISVPSVKMGNVAVELLLKHLSTKEQETTESSIDLGFTIVERESC